MTSLQSKADAVKAAVASTTTCTPTTTALLKELLMIDLKPAEAAPTATKAGSRPRAKTTTAKPTTAGKTSREELPDDEKKALAVHVVNGALKALLAAAKPTAHVEPRPPAERKRLRRSNSTPMSPLQPRTLNRVATSPSLVKDDKNATELPKMDIGCLSTVECLRVAFSYLRSLQDAGKKALPDHHLEAGMSRFVGAMITLGIHEPAQKELAILKRRLDTIGKRKSGAKSDPAAKRNLADLLDYGDATFSGSIFELAATTQLHVLRLIAELKNPALTETALPTLRSSYLSSPLQLLLRLAAESAQLRTKAARQLQQFSQLILSIPPNVSSADDNVAMEARLSPYPHIAAEYHAIGFEYRLHWWSVAKHKAEVDDDILRPLSKCLTAFLRRSPTPTEPAYQMCSKSFDRLGKLIAEQGLEPSVDSTSPTASIHQTLGMIAEGARLWDEAASWFHKLRRLPDTEDDSVAKRSVIAARLLAVSLRQSSSWPEPVSVLLQELIDSMQAPLRGETSELDDMMESLCVARKAAVRAIVQSTGEEQRTGDETADLCRTLVLQFPRFSYRWLGKNPGRDADAKKQLRFSKRKIVLETHAAPILDSALSVIKSQIDTKKATWEETDETLQNCLAMIDNLGEAHLPLPKDRANTYHVKVSQLYFLFCNDARRKGDSKMEYRALKRSIDCVKDRSAKEKDRASLPQKLERYSAICKQGGRQDDSREALKAICTTMVEDGVLADVAMALDDKAPSVVWASNPKAQTLSRTLVAMVKLDQSWSDWTFFLPEVQRAAVLEHIVYINLTESSLNSTKNAPNSATDALLRIYSVEKFPVRRLRTLLHLMGVSLDNKEQFEDLRCQAEAALEACQGQNLDHDVSLAAYVPHFRAYLGSTLALTSSDLNSVKSGIGSALSSWKHILSDCKSGADLAATIDNPERLLKHLESLGQFAKLKGAEQLQLSASEIAADIARLLSEKSLRSLLNSYSTLADAYVSLGYETKAEQVFSKVAQLPIASEEVCVQALANLHLSSVEYQLAVNNRSKAESILAEARAAFEKHTSRTSLGGVEKLVLARAHLLYSLLSLHKGEALQALHHARLSMRILYAAWLKLEAGLKPSQSTTLTSSVLGLSVSSQPTQEGAIQLSDGPEFWPLGSAVLRSLLRLSAVYQHLGMFQETLYYAEKAVDIANRLESPSCTTQAQSWMGAVWIKANNPEKGLPALGQAREFVLSYEQPTHSMLRLACELSASYGQMKDHDSEASLIQVAEDILKELNRRDGTGNMRGLAEQMEKLDLKPAAGRTTRATRTTKATTVRTAATRTVKKPATQTRPRVATATPVQAEEQFPALRKLMLIRKSFVLVGKGEWAAASALLEEARHVSPTAEEPLEAQVNAAACLIGESLEQMISDSVFSVVQDSTISFPSVAQSVDKVTADKASGALSPPRKVRGRPAAVKTKAAAHSFVQTLQRALQHLTEAHSRAIVTGNGHLIHRIAALLQSTTIFLSAASNHDLKGLPHVDFATCSMELARNITWKRERRAVLVDSDVSRHNETGWPVALNVEDESTASVVTDMAKFQHEYIDIIPPAWRTISMSLSDNRQDLCITKLEAGRSPFVLRLPLERASSRDADVDVFDFEHGHSRLLEIIRLSNESCHAKGRDWTVPGAKAAWWKEREELDEHMKELLETVEQVWLNGFKGIFSQHQYRAGLFAKFQKAFYTILDKHLPSRRQVGGKKTAKNAKVTLDTRILDLFIGLGDPAEDGDLDEPLQDLLYFVVDILQFHGERNAYDEVDFDSMTIDAMDALKAYHQAASNQVSNGESTHTILVLDKSLHAFPWESLPCMQGDAISRVPSMACLRRLILEQQQVANRPGHNVSPQLGTYMLNPGNDLKGTQETFEKPLSTLGGSWTSYVAQAPTDGEFETALRDSDLLIYVGHGSGAQYVRSRTIRKLKKCRATALLMGCSSASLVDAGEFEVHGPVWNYMMAGCPAVVGTLWDVTDRDIDRYAGRLFEEWGLFDKGTFKTDKWSERGTDGKATKRGAVSLVEAIERSRAACRFRYITAGAVCVYGIPVYVRKD